MAGGTQPRLEEMRMSLPSALLADRRTAGDPNPADQITVTLGDKTFLVGRRTAAHIQATIAQLAIEFPSAHLHVMQSCNHKGYALSEGTHDFDGVLDFRIEGLDGSLAQWWQAQAFLRRMGWACWLRHTGDWADPSDWHVHAVSIGCPAPVGFYVPAQVDDYYGHALGLKGQHDSGDDLSSFPPDIDSTVFDYPTWLEEQPMSPEDKQWISDLLDTKLNAYAAAKPKGSTLSRDQLLKQAQSAADEVRDLLKDQNKTASNKGAR